MTDQAVASEGVRLKSSTGRYILAAAVLGSGMALLDGTVVNVALRSIGRDLDASLAQLQWVTNGYMLVAGVADLDRRLARRPVRPPTSVPHRRHVVRRRLGRCAGLPQTPEQLIAARVAAGHRGRAAHAGQPGDDPGQLPPGRPRSCDRLLVRPRRHRRCHRALRRRLAGRVRELAMGRSASTCPCRSSPCVIAPPARARDQGPDMVRGLRRAGRGAGCARPRGDHVRPDRVRVDARLRRSGRSVQAASPRWCSSSSSRSGRRTR